MLFLKISFIIVLSVYVILLLFFCHKDGRFFKTLFLSVLTGIAVLTVVNLTSRFTGVCIPVNAWTCGSSALFGIPGVLGILLIRMFF